MHQMQTTPLIKVFSAAVACADAELVQLSYRSVAAAATRLVGHASVSFVECGPTPVLSNCRPTKLLVCCSWMLYPTLALSLGWLLRCIPPHTPDLLQPPGQLGSLSCCKNGMNSLPRQQCPAFFSYYEMMALRQFGLVVHQLCSRPIHCRKGTAWALVGGFPVLLSHFSVGSQVS